MDNEKLITSANLNEFFYKNLCETNRQIPCPLPEEFIFYSSLVLERYATSEMFFDSEAGKINEKILGIKLLEAQKHSKNEKFTELKDVGDTILVQLGVFSESVKKKITNRGYYISLAQNAYHQLDKMDPQFYDIPNFYKLFASSFENTLNLLETMSNDFIDSENQQFLIDTIDFKKAI